MSRDFKGISKILQILASQMTFQPWFSGLYSHIQWNSCQYRMNIDEEAEAIDRKIKNEWKGKKIIQKYHHAESKTVNGNESVEECCHYWYCNLLCWYDCYGAHMSSIKNKILYFYSELSCQKSSFSFPLSHCSEHMMLPFKSLRWLPLHSCIQPNFIFNLQSPPWSCSPLFLFSYFIES